LLDIIYKLIKIIIITIIKDKDTIAKKEDKKSKNKIL